MKKLKKKRIRKAKRRNIYNGFIQYNYSENQYNYKIDTKITYRDRIKDLEDEFNKRGYHISLIEGNNIKLEKEGDKTYKINVALKNDYEEKYSSGEYVIKSGSDLDDVTALLIKSINENSDAIDGEEIKL